MSSETPDPSIKRSRLGRGLDAILPMPSMQAGPVRDPSQARIEDVYPNRDQPRTRFAEAGLEELAASIKQHGILEPILVRRRIGGGYEIVAGERRWRAAQRAGLRDIPIFVRELSPQVAFEAALVENLQREDLNAVEIARAFQRLIEDHGYTPESIAARLSKDRSTIANALRLLKLPAPVLAMIENGEITEGHGRAILAAGAPSAMIQLAKETHDNDWSVREIERRVRSAAAPKAAASAPNRSANVRDLEERLTRTLGTRVRVVDRKGRGRLEISFSSYEDLDRVLGRLQ